MGIETTLGIIGGVLFLAGLVIYLKLKNTRAGLAGFGITLAGIILIAVAIVGLPA